MTQFNFVRARELQELQSYRIPVWEIS